LAERRIDPGPLSVVRNRDSIVIRYGDFETTLPVPSQESIDRWVDRYLPFVTGAIVALVGVVVGKNLSEPTSRT
jgi:hypothetical protein